MICADLCSPSGICFLFSEVKVVVAKKSKADIPAILTTKQKPRHLTNIKPWLRLKDNASKWLILVWSWQVVSTKLLNHAHIPDNRAVVAAVFTLETVQIMSIYFKKKFLYFDHLMKPNLCATVTGCPGFNSNIPVDGHVSVLHLCSTLLLIYCHISQCSQT